MKGTTQAHGLAFSSLLMIVGLSPFGLLSPGAAPKPLYARAYSPEDIRAEFAREQKQEEYARVQLAHKGRRADRWALVANHSNTAPTSKLRPSSKNGSVNAEQINIAG